MEACEWLASLQYKPVKPAFVPGRLQRQDILLPQMPEAFHIKSVGLFFINGKGLFVRRRHWFGSYIKAFWI
jgi:hypothetical protein